MTGHAIAAVGSGRNTCHMPHDDAAGAPAEPSFRALVRELTREWAPRFPSVGRRLHPDLFAAENAEESWGWDVGGRRAWMTHDGQTRTVDLTGIKEGRDALERIRVHQPEAMAEWLAADTLHRWVQATGAHTTADDTKPSTLRARLRAMPELHRGSLYPNQVRAITNLERSFRDNRPRSLVPVAEGQPVEVVAVEGLRLLVRPAPGQAESRPPERSA